jgi:hypothetical protein
MLDAEFITALVGLPEFEIIDGIIREDGIGQSHYK